MFKALSTVTSAALVLAMLGCDGKSGPSDTVNNNSNNGGSVKSCKYVGIIRKPEDSAVLEGCKRVEGTVYLMPDYNYKSLRDFHLTSLEEVTGQFYVSDSSGLVELEGVNNLRKVSEDVLILYNTNLKDISALGRLAKVRNLLVNNNPALPKIVFQGLQTATGEMQISFNDSLKYLEFPVLETIDHLNMVGNKELIQVDFPAILHLGTLSGYNPKLEDYGQLKPFM